MRTRCRIGNKAVVIMSAAFAILLSLAVTADAGFLFPDLASFSIHRSGGRSGYGIAALEVEPYLRPDGTGYLPDLMKAIAAKYSRVRNGTISFHYEIMPVGSWEELNEKSRVEHVKVAFGFVSPYLLRHDARYKDIHASIATVRTSVKLISRTTSSRDVKHDNGDALDTASRKMHLISVTESPMDRLLVRHHLRHNVVYEVNSLDVGLDDLHHHGSSYLISDATVADSLVTTLPERSLQSVCPGKRLFHGGHPVYAFFGRNSMLIKFLNDLLKVLEEENVLQNLNVRYFGNVIEC